MTDFVFETASVMVSQFQLFDFVRLTIICSTTNKSSYWMRPVSKKYFNVENVAPVCYPVQSNCHQYVHTVPYKPSRSQSIPLKSPYKSALSNCCHLHIRHITNRRFRLQFYWFSQHSFCTHCPFLVWSMIMVSSNSFLETTHVYSFGDQQSRFGGGQSHYLTPHIILLCKGCQGKAVTIKNLKIDLTFWRRIFFFKF